MTKKEIKSLEDSLKELKNYKNEKEQFINQYISNNPGGYNQVVVSSIAEQITQVDLLIDNLNNMITKYDRSANKWRYANLKNL